MRNVSKWSLCFRQPSTIEIDDGVACSADRMLSLIAAARNSNRLNNKNKKKQEKNKSPETKILETSNPDHHPPPRTLRRSLSSVIKAVVIETSLSRRVRESKSLNRSDREPIATADQTTAEDKSAISVDMKSGPEKTTIAPPATENIKQSEIGTGSPVRINPVVFVVLLSLWVTVFWGRVCAVMTTTLWIYAWQSGVVVIGLGEMLKLRKDKKKKKARSAMEDEEAEEGETEKGTDNLSAKGNKLIEGGSIGI